MGRLYCPVYAAKGPLHHLQRPTLRAAGVGWFHSPPRLLTASAEFEAEPQGSRCFGDAVISLGVDNHARYVAANSHGERCLDIGGLPPAGSHGRAKLQACLRYFDKSTRGRQNQSGVIAVGWRCAVRLALNLRPVGSLHTNIGGLLPTHTRHWRCSKPVSQTSICGHWKTGYCN